MSRDMGLESVREPGLETESQSDVCMDETEEGLDTWKRSGRGLEPECPWDMTVLEFCKPSR